MIVLQLAFTYVPVMNRVFESAPIDIIAWGGIAGFSLLLAAIVAIEKMVRGKSRK